tara:strand:+ start:979 stop:1134 length:156 start_codon:yes stop_codon:yes gene_type:complete
MGYPTQQQIYNAIDDNTFAILEKLQKIESILQELSEKVAKLEGNLNNENSI